MPAAGDFDYDAHGRGYSQQRWADPRVQSFVHRALGGARSIVNVGAGSGSYEPLDRHVIAVEPSAEMRAQRPAQLGRRTRCAPSQPPAPAAGAGASCASRCSGCWGLPSGLRGFQ